MQNFSVEVHDGFSEAKLFILEITVLREQRIEPKTDSLKRMYKHKASSVTKPLKIKRNYS
ncbi:hypothetical protein AOB46_04190 [Chryseobacterium indologenes]|uniref:Uncharacterized protein n=1 Tax=Chryseobacterium indologenes TaxID=253 RepID=A0A0N0IX99_CHRID|nr:hypothetical protein AOB46_04190 [Chryseobacterium indologenes]